MADLPPSHAPKLNYQPGETYNSATFQDDLQEPLEIESNVSALWLHIIQYYFPSAEGYSTRRTEHYTEQRTKIDLLVIHSNVPAVPRRKTWVVLIELESSGETFGGSFRQFESCLTSESIPNNHGDVAGVLAVGRKAKFYRWQQVPGSTTIHKLVQMKITDCCAQHDKCRAVDIGNEIQYVHDFMVQIKQAAQDY